MAMNEVKIWEEKPCRTGSGTTIGYSVEARMNYSRPETILGTAYDNRWQRVQIVAGDSGVPMKRSPALDHVDLYSFETAEALRWWFIAAAEASRIGGSLCIETRLVRHRVEYSYSAKPVAYVGARDGRGDMPEDMQEILAAREAKP